MLRSAGIRSKILAVLVVPLVFLGITTGLLATQQVQQARQAYQVEKIAEIGGPFAQLVRGIEAERAVTAAALQGSPEATEALPGVRAQVDEGLATSRAAVADIDFSRLSEQSEEALARVESAHVELEVVRSKVDGGGASVDTVMAGFVDVLREDLAMPGRVAAGVEDPATADLLLGFGALLTTRDLALREQEAGLRVLTRTPTAADPRELDTLAPAQEEELARWQFAVGSAESDEMATLMGQQRQTVWSIGRARVALSSPGTVAQTGLTPELWTEITDARIGALDASLAGIAADVQTQAEAASQRATLLAALAVAAAVVGVGVTLLLSLVLARRIARPLRELTAAADRVRDQLPRMVEQMRSPGDMPEVELPRIEVVGDDEVGRLAAAFNAVNDTVVEVAVEQAALRGSIAETFVNVARRNQVLLSRQLSFIDQLEQREENPDTLENLFRLDHLATRMRRNAESLLVLANIDAGRKLRQPLALSDVIRTAASEIEQYERVNLALQVDPPTMGHLALQLAHLLAEILENGTNFSEPHTPVLVATSRTAEGIRITVTDEGLGLTDDELSSARAKISDFAADDVVTSQRLGFFVVGRLARRLGVKVSIRRGPAKGLVVTVDLPPALFVPGTVRVAAPQGGAEQGPGTPAGPAAPGALPSRSQAAAPVPAPTPTAPTSPQAPTVRPPQQRPPVPAPGIPMPTAEPTAVPQVTVTPGSPSLPRRGGTPAAPAAAVPVAPVAAAPVVASSPAVPSLAAPSSASPSPSLPSRAEGPAAPTVTDAPVTAPSGGALPLRVAPSSDEPAPASPVVAAGATALPTRARLDVTPEPVAPAPTAPALAAASKVVPAPVAPSPVAASPAAPASAPAAPEGVAPVDPSAPVAPTADPADPPAGDDAPRDGAPGHPPRRAGLFGAFRARREVNETAPASTVADLLPPAPADPTDPAAGPAAPPPAPAARPVVPSSAVAPTAVPSTVVPPVTVAPATSAPVVPPTAGPAAPAAQPSVARPSAAPAPAAAPVAPPAPSAPSVPAPAPAAAPVPTPRRDPASAPSAQPVAAAPQARPAPAPAASPTPAARPADARPTPVASAAPVAPAAPEPAPMLPTPVDILPGGARRRGRRSLFGSGRPATPPAPVAAPTPVRPVHPAPSGQVPAVTPPPRPSFPAVPAVPAQGTGPVRQPAQAAPTSQAQPFPTPVRPADPEPSGPGATDRAHPAGSVLGGVPVVAALADGEAIRQRSMLASEALSELSRLSSYSPSAVEGRSGPAPLVRRQPAATEAAKLPTPPTTPAPERRPRSAADVRSMLSGFQSGVTRGRAGSGEDADPDEPAPVPVPSTTGRTPTGPTTATRTTDTRTTD